LREKEVNGRKRGRKREIPLYFNHPAMSWFEGDIKITFMFDIYFSA